MQRQLPTVSIVTPSFNHARYIEATIRSVLEQGYPNLQYLVMDGGSTDGTIDILKKYEGKLQWISEKDNGQADAIRRGFELATGEVIAWLNSDDVYKPGAIAAAATYLADHPDVGLVYGDAEFIRSDGSAICPCANPEPFSRHRLRHYSDYIIQPAAFFRRSVYQAVGGLDATLHWAMDYDLWLKLADQYQFVYVPQCWAQYRWLGDNKSAAGSWQRIDEVRRVTEKHGIRRLPAYFRMELINLHLQAAKAAWPGRPVKAAGSLLTAAAHTLSSPRAIKSLFDPQTRRIIATGKVLRRVSGSLSPEGRGLG